MGPLFVQADRELAWGFGDHVHFYEDRYRYVSSTLTRIPDCQKHCVQTGTKEIKTCSIGTAPTSTNVRLAIKIAQLPDRKCPPSRSAEVRNPCSGVCLWETSSASRPGPSLILLLQNDIDVHSSSSHHNPRLGPRQLHSPVPWASAFLTRTCGGSTTQR